MHYPLQDTAALCGPQQRGCAGVRHRNAPLEPEEAEGEGGLKSGPTSRAQSAELQDDSATTGLVNQEVVRCQV